MILLIQLCKCTYIYSNFVYFDICIKFNTLLKSQKKNLYLSVSFKSLDALLECYSENNN